ncbi:lasso peptide biosynthesis B2 protein [Candidatus Nitronereus thalassa]|uniref:lasso peptide biosynthesis B2 protein n=1 Tax=Candidatus Nitronereus thalassa TaxID=3020898 RepID=UPI003B9684C9
MRKQKWGWPNTPPKNLSEFLLAWQVLGVTSVLRLFVRWVKLPTLLRWLTPYSASAVPRHHKLSIVDRYITSVLDRFPSNPRGCCLVRSLALYAFGRRSGFPVHFHCGVSRVNGELQGHAWLSLHNQPFLESGNPFTTNVVTYSYPHRDVKRGVASSTWRNSGLARPSNLSQTPVSNGSEGTSMVCTAKDRS